MSLLTTLLVFAFAGGEASALEACCGDDLILGKTFFRRVTSIPLPPQIFFLGPRLPYDCVGMLGKRKAIPTLLPPRKRRKPTSAIEEIAFDLNAREDYLTGFHKRKLQRIKHAKEEAAKKDREEKLNARKIVCLNISLVVYKSDLKVIATGRTESRP